MKINHPLVNPHLELVPSFGTFTTRSLTGGDTEGFGRHSDGSFYLQFLLLGSPDEIAAHFLERLDVPGGEGDPNPVHGGLFLHPLSILISSRHSRSS